MGTNFYAILPTYNSQKKEFEDLLNRIEEQFKSATEYNLHEVAQNVTNLSCRLKLLEKEKKIHLGKKSVGWAFLWDLNECEYYKPSLKSIQQWVEKNNAIIKDENDIIYTWDEFINKAIGESLHPSKAITTVEKLNKLKLPDYRKDIIKLKFIDKGLPYYRFCTDKTYQEMYPNDSICYLEECATGGGYNHILRRLDIDFYDKYIDSKESSYVEFITKDGLRFSKYTNFK